MTYNELWRLLAQVYDDGEAKAVARMVYELRFGLTLSDIYLGKDTQLSANHQKELTEISQQLVSGEPVQYVLGQADFCGRTFVVNPSVLIPRPETEELCRWIISEVRGERLEVRGQRSEVRDYSILDIGTGSGCIAVTLAAELPEAKVTAWDISEEALSVAQENAQRHHVPVTFEQVDVFNIPHPPSTVPRLPSLVCRSPLSIIVSNPPYICNKERATMEANVLDHEPHTALFVPDDDPLLFYRAIAKYGQTVLKSGGWLYFEINPLYAEDLRQQLHAMSYHDIAVKEDQYGKQRMIRACKR